MGIKNWLNRWYNLILLSQAVMIKIVWNYYTIEDMLGKISTKFSGKQSFLFKVLDKT